MERQTAVLEVFQRCCEAVARGALIHRESKTDKEFHFQNWVQHRIDEAGLNYDIPGRNTYPDFRLVHFPEGYEVKGLAYPGRVADFDSNSQVPSGLHSGRTIFYIFGRYPEKPDGDSYPVMDLVLCHGDFLNATHEYIHKNKSVKGFGTYGDIMIRDRKMYVVPTPFGLVSGVAHTQTLILPEEFHITHEYDHIGTIVRTEAQEIVVSYEFNLRDNTLTPQTIKNPSSGHKRVFNAWRIKGASRENVSLRITETGSQESPKYGERTEH